MHSLEYTFLPWQVLGRFRGSGFRVQGSGFRVQGSGFRVQGSWFRVQGSGFEVQGLECGQGRQGARRKVAETQVVLSSLGSGHRLTCMDAT